MKINFLSDSNTQDFSEAISEYENIWEEHGENIVTTWEEVTGLKFQETDIDATVYDGKSYSTPLHLRHNYDSDRKKSILVHELGHSLIGKYVSSESSLENHKNLYLVLYTVLKKLFGEKFADESVAWEKDLTPMYKEAWEWVLDFTEIERGKRFENLIKQ